jgi:small subunit ribosomal protein S2
MSAVSQISLMDLFKVGSHRGNKKQKLNPKLRSFVYGAKQGLSLIDLAKMQDSLARIEELLFSLGKTRKQVLIVGTQKHVQTKVKELAAAMGAKGMPFINQRWLGGTLTNWATVKKTLKTLEKNEKILENAEFFATLSRNEQLNITRETEKLRQIFGGLVDLRSNRPGAVLVLDGENNHVAIQEADAMKVATISLLNTASVSLPSHLDFALVCNNNSKLLIDLLSGRFADAYNNGLAEAAEVQTTTPHTGEGHSSPRTSENQPSPHHNQPRRN